MLKFVQTKSEKTQPVEQTHHSQSWQTPKACQNVSSFTSDNNENDENELRVRDDCEINLGVEQPQPTTYVIGNNQVLDPLSLKMVEKEREVLNVNEFLLNTYNRERISRKKRLFVICVVLFAIALVILAALIGELGFQMFLKAHF